MPYHELLDEKHDILLGPLWLRYDRLKDVTKEFRKRSTLGSTACHFNSSLITHGLIQLICASKVCNQSQIVNKVIKFN